MHTRILEWLAISYPAASSWPKDQTYLSSIFCVDRQFFTMVLPGKPHSLITNLELILSYLIIFSLLFYISRYPGRYFHLIFQSLYIFFQICSHVFNFQYLLIMWLNLLLLTTTSSWCILIYLGSFKIFSYMISISSKLLCPLIIVFNFKNYLVIPGCIILLKNWLI